MKELRDREGILKALKEGMSIRRTGEIFGVSKSSIHRMKLTAGIKGRVKKKERKRTHP